MNKLLWIFLMSPAVALAASAGEAELNVIEGLLTGNIGLAIGLIITVWGLFKTFVNGETGGGILLLVCGVLLTIFPGVFNAAGKTIYPIVQNITGK